MNQTSVPIVPSILYTLLFYVWTLFKRALYKPLKAIELRLRRLCIQVFRQGPIPSHVAFIMDGNRRFAKRNRLSRTVEGHAAGFEGLHQTMEWCYELGISVVTVYAFSIENFNRSPEEVSTLMSLALDKFRYMSEHSDLVKKYDIQIRVIGELELLPEEVRTVVGKTMEMTAGNMGPIINICFPYTAKAELITVSNGILEDFESGELQPCDLDVAGFESRLYTKDCPPLDILVRTSGEKRLSEFLNWQLANDQSQIEFLDILWPDFRFRYFVPILARFQLRKMVAQYI